MVGTGGFVADVKRHCLVGIVFRQGLVWMDTLSLLVKHWVGFRGYESLVVCPLFTEK